MREYSKLFIESLYKTTFTMNVLFAVVVMILPAVFLFFSPVMIFDVLSWRKDPATKFDDNHLPQSVLSTELQSRMKSFLVRNSAACEPMGNEFVVASRSSATQSHGSINLLT